MLNSLLNNRLTDDETRRLCRLVKEGDKDAMRHIIEGYWKFIVWCMVRAYEPKRPLVSDIAGFAVEAFAKHVRSYNPSMQVSLRQYARRSLILEIRLGKRRKPIIGRQSNDVISRLSRRIRNMESESSADDISSLDDNDAKIALWQHSTAWQRLRACDVNDAATGRHWNGKSYVQRETVLHDDFVGVNVTDLERQLLNRFNARDRKIFEQVVFDGVPVSDLAIRYKRHRYTIYSVVRKIKNCLRRLAELQIYRSTDPRIDKSRFTPNYVYNLHHGHMFYPLP